MTKYPVIVVDLPKPVSGFWDDGMKSHFEFKPDPKSINQGEIKWGSYAANFWFMAKPGVSWNSAVANAKKKLQRMLKIKNATISVVWMTD